MPLKEVSTPHYIKRTRIAVDSRERDLARSKSRSDYVFNVPEQIQNVIGIELVGWCFDTLYAPTYIGRYNTFAPQRFPGDEIASPIAGLHTADIMLQDPNNLNRTMVFTIDAENFLGIPGGSASFCWFLFESSTITVQVMALATTFTFLGLNDPNFNTGNTQLQFQTDDLSVFNMYWYDSATFEPFYSFFLFKSGPTASDQASRALGFEPFVDTSIPPLFDVTPNPPSNQQYVLFGDYKANAQPCRYLNVHVKEVTEDFDPLARVYIDRISDPEYKRPCNEGSNMRLLSNPVRRLDRLSIRLMVEDYRVGQLQTPDHQLTFDVLSLAQESSIPTWVKQKVVMNEN